MHEELVERRRWISEQRFLHALNYCMVLPGPEAQQLATYIGWLMHRTWGGVVAGGLFVLPSLFILVGLSWVYMAFGSLPAVAGLFYGIKPAVTAIVVSAAYRIGSRTLKNAWLWVVAVAAFVAIFAVNLPFPLIVLAAGLVGVGRRRVYAPDKVPALRFERRTRRGAPFASGARADRRRHADAGACALHLEAIRIGARPCRRAVGAGFRAASRWAFGWRATLTQMGWFFTKAALLTFGGAYAVLPYVYQGAVDQQHWLSAAQMIDGLALGETTPGPLIMVVAFVGFVGGWTQCALFGAGCAVPSSASLAAAVVTFFTFLPSFLFILLGGPFIETTHGNLKFTAPLTGITAAVVGVIVNLAVFFAYHVLWPGRAGLGCL